MVMATGEAESEEDEENDARLPRTKKVPVGMTAAEWNSHKLTHLPYNPACRCCVAGRKRDDQHRRRDKGPLQAQAELDAEKAHRYARTTSFLRMLQERKE